MTNKLLDDFYLEIDLTWKRKDIEQAIKFFNTDYENNILKDIYLNFIIFG